VIASFAERRAEIVRQLAAAAARAGGKPIDDDALLDEVTALVERPNVLIGQFEPEFLAVPQECLILTMKANQKYFPLLDAAGKLTNKFLVVSNISPADLPPSSAATSAWCARAWPMPSSSSTRTARSRWKAASPAWPRWSITTSWAPRASACSALPPSPAPSPQLAAANWCSTPNRPPCWPRPTC
jgi:hypothetical protein